MNADITVTAGLNESTTCDKNMGKNKGMKAGTNKGERRKKRRKKKKEAKEEVNARNQHECRRGCGHEFRHENENEHRKYETDMNMRIDADRSGKPEHRRDCVLRLVSSTWENSFGA